MRQRLRSSLTYANVMATLAVFLVLGGGTALGAYVVSSNDQVGPNTISGHKPPSGEHANMIPGTVNGQDVADNSLRGADVNESTLAKVPSAASADSVGGKSASQLEGARASALVLGGNCDASGFCPVVRSRRVAYAFHADAGKYCVGVDGIPANDPRSLAVVSPAFAQPNQWTYWRWSVYGDNDVCVGSEYEIYTILQGSGFTDMRFTIAIP